MPDYCSCGTQLVEGARFCHRCGATQGELFAPEEPMEEAAPAVRPPEPPALPQVVLSEISFHNKAAVAVAMLVALLYWLVTFLPLPPLIQVPLLFIDLLAGGFFAVWFYARRTGQTLTIRNGAHLGWLTGIFCFAIGAVVAAINMLALSLTPNVPSSSTEILRRSFSANRSPPLTRRRPVATGWSAPPMVRSNAAYPHGGSAGAQKSRCTRRTLSAQGVS